MSTPLTMQLDTEAFPVSNNSQDYAENLRGVIDKIHAAGNIDEIMLDVSKDICVLFNADRLTIYTISEDKTCITSRVKTGLDSFQDLRLPINEHSIAGFASLHKKIINFKDVYDRSELKALGAQLRFLQEVDKRTGYRTKQMLVAPVLNMGDNDLLGVVQVINNKDDVPFPQTIVNSLSEVCQTLAAAFKQRLKQQLLGRTRYDRLIANGVISATEFELATRNARETGLSLEDVLIDAFNIEQVQVGEALAAYFGVKYEPFKADRIRPLDLLKNLKREFVESSSWLPIDDSADGLTVLTLDPERIKALRIVNQIFPKRKIIYAVCTQREFRAMLDLFYGGTGVEDDGDSIGEMLSGLEEDTEDAPGETDEASAAADNELVKLVNRIIMDAYKMGVSDIHVEPLPGKGKTRIRFRKDGSLMPYIEIPSSYRNPLVTRIKIMCDLDISEKRRPQDGKIKFRKFAPLDIELRVATIPSAGGVEDVVMRILAAGEPIPLDKMGFTTYNLKELKSLVAKPYGLFFVCGPTGSGKTTTLHSILKHLNTPQTKIWTAEDPVEITQKGLRQVQINPKAGLTFATVMKSFLRADPDIIMVGEMRDKETTSIGIEASLTGHLVFATLHTNSAPESIIRLLDMGMDPFNFADALLGILAQRLAKRLCKCKKSHVASTEEIRMLLTEYCEDLKNIDHFKADPDTAYREIGFRWIEQYGDENKQIILYKPVGCDHCAGTGYAGRVGLHELLTATDALKKNIQEHARVAEMLVTALHDGMRTLRQDGIEKVLQGITDIHQVRAVCIK
jgi:type II secretory ATPase GspE/PulE/Tfp pilus assembly ATPase PilB-like protein